MLLAMKATVTTMSSMPWRTSRSMMCSIIGRLTSGSIGLGLLEVRGRSRVPSPPAMITAFTGPHRPSRDRPPRAGRLAMTLSPRPPRPARFGGFGARAGSDAGRGPVAGGPTFAQGPDPGGEGTDEGDHGEHQARHRRAPGHQLEEARPGLGDALVAGGQERREGDHDAEGPRLAPPG